MLNKFLKATGFALSLASNLNLQSEDVKVKQLLMSYRAVRLILDKARKVEWFGLLFNVLPSNKVNQSVWEGRMEQPNIPEANPLDCSLDLELDLVQVSACSMPC